MLVALLTSLNNTNWRVTACGAIKSTYPGLNSWLLSWWRILPCRFSWTRTCDGDKLPFPKSPFQHRWIWNEIRRFRERRDDDTEKSLRFMIGRSETMQKRKKLSSFSDRSDLALKRWVGEKEGKYECESRKKAKESREQRNVTMIEGKRSLLAGHCYFFRNKLGLIEKKLP